MRIQNVCEKTKLSKKTIHFYINEGLINPNKDQENGYYDFSEADINKLELIMLFRRTNMSIQSIKEVFKYKTLTNFFLHRQMNIIKDNIYQEMRSLEYLSNIIKSIPPNATPQSLSNKYILNDIYPDNSYQDVLESYFPNNDARMLAIMVWAPFLEQAVDEYRQFLWNKIANELTVMFSDYVIYLKRLVYALTPEMINEVTNYSYNLYKEITDNDNLGHIEDLLYTKCLDLINNKQLQAYWIALYDNYLEPTLLFYQGNAHELMLEYNIRYSTWFNKVNTIIKHTYQRLSSDQMLLNQLDQALQHKFNLNEAIYSDLLLILTFDQSFCVKLPIKVIKEKILV